MLEVGDCLQGAEVRRADEGEVGRRHIASLRQEVPCFLGHRSGLATAFRSQLRVVGEQDAVSSRFILHLVEPLTMPDENQHAFAQ